MVYYGLKGNDYYILDNNSGDIKKFDRFGTERKGSYGISDCSKWNKVDYISLVESDEEVEAFTNAGVIRKKGDFFEVIGSIRMNRGYLGTCFHRIHMDKYGSFNQVIFIYPEGTVNKVFLAKCGLN